MRKKTMNFLSHVWTSTHLIARQPQFPEFNYVGVCLCLCKEDQANARWMYAFQCILTVCTLTQHTVQNSSCLVNTLFLVNIWQLFHMHFILYLQPSSR